MGYFITVEGIDGCGKSTQIARIADYLKSFSSLVLTREPGGTAFGEEIRSILLEGKHNLSPETEALAAYTARKQHLDEIIEPALASHKIVLCDRFTLSTWAYQGEGSGADLDLLTALEAILIHRKPDLTIIYDIPFSASSKRMDLMGKSKDRYESESNDFFHRTRKGMLKHAAKLSHKHVVVDASLNIDEVWSATKLAIDTFIEQVGD